MDETKQIIIYQGEDDETRIEVKFTDETVWLSHQQMQMVTIRIFTNINVIDTERML